MHHEDLWQLCRDELTGVDVRIDGWDIRGRWFGVVVGATPRTGELPRGETIPQGMSATASGKACRRRSGIYFGRCKCLGWRLEEVGQKRQSSTRVGGQIGEYGSDLCAAC